MAKVLVIGCGGVAQVAIRKCCQNSGVFTDICIASRTVSKCEALKEKIQKTETASPSITNVLSFSSLQRQHDARRFSWGTVRDAIRFKPTVQSNLTLKILNIK